jgi:small basic protein
MRPSVIGTAGLALGLVVGIILGRLTTVPIWEAATTVAAGAVAAHLVLLWGNR